MTLRTRFLLSLLVPALLFLSLASFAGYLFARRAVEDEIGRGLSGIAGSAASQLSGERLLLLEPGDDRGEGTRTYRNLLAVLTEVKAATGARRLFAFDREGRVFLDEGGGIPIGAEAPELSRDRLELSRVFESGERSASLVLFEGSDGQLYKTGYAPIRHEGKIIGAVGAEGSAELFRPLQSLLSALLALTFAGLVVLLAAALLSARAVSAPLDRLRRAADQIGRGDLDTPVTVDAEGEVGILAARLEQMRKDLHSRDQQLKTMLAGVAHEVRNPLGGIELFAALLDDELPAGEPKERVARIRKEVDYLRRIVEDFLAFAREQKLERHPFDPAELVKAAASRLEADALEKQIRVEVTATPATLDGDEALLIAAVVNLLKNALQASPAGATVTVRGASQAPGYRIEIEDPGPGIPDDLKPRIFEAFFTTREKGSGLGLPLTKKIVEAHGGVLSLDSRPGRTIFRLELPVLPKAGE